MAMWFALSMPKYREFPGPARRKTSHFTITPRGPPCEVGVRAKGTGAPIDKRCALS